MRTSNCSEQRQKAQKSHKSHQYHAVQSGAEAKVSQQNPAESEAESLSKDIIQQVRVVDGDSKEPICCLLSHNLGHFMGGHVGIPCCLFILV